MFARIFSAILVAAALSVGSALASEFDGWTVKQITSHPDFVRSDESMSSAYNHGGPGARRVYDWIGYIPTGDSRVYFTSFGEPLTCVQWQETGEWVPEWVEAALNELVEGGYITIDGEGNMQPDDTLVVEGRG